MLRVAERARACSSRAGKSTPQALAFLLCHLLVACWIVLSAAAAVLPDAADYAPHNLEADRSYALSRRARKQRDEDKPVLERNVGAVKGYTVLVIVLSGIIVIIVIAWFWYLTYSKKNKK